MARNFLRELRSEVLSDDVATQWEGKAGLLEPPGAHVFDQGQAFGGVGQLPFMNKEAEVDTAVLDRRLDFVERRRHRDEVRLVEAQREISRGQRAGDRDP